MTSYGATVFTIVAVEMVGKALHRLEYEPDVLLISRTPQHSRLRERWWLRSDLFPQCWEGIEVVMRISEGELGVDAFVPVIRTP